MELLRQADWTDRPDELFHYRDKQQREVDVIIERHDGNVIGIEVKAGATPHSSDFAGLRHLRDTLGDPLQGRRHAAHRRRRLPRHEPEGLR